jgi:hypothetical protein
MDGAHLAFVAVLGVLAYIGSYLLERKFGPFPEESETRPFWWDLPCGCPIEDNDDDHRRYGDPLALPPYNSFDEESKR